MARVKDLWVTYPVRKGRGKRWLAVWINPAGREQSQAFDRKADAEKYASKMEADIARGGYIDPAKARLTVGSGVGPGLMAMAQTRNQQYGKLEFT